MFFVMEVKFRCGGGRGERFRYKFYYVTYEAGVWDGVVEEGRVDNNVYIVREREREIAEEN